MHLDEDEALFYKKQFRLRTMLSPKPIQMLEPIQVAQQNISYGLTKEEVIENSKWGRKF